MNAERLKGFVGARAAELRAGVLSGDTKTEMLGGQFKAVARILEERVEKRLHGDELEEMRKLMPSLISFGAGIAGYTPDDERPRAVTISLLPFSETGVMGNFSAPSKIRVGARQLLSLVEGEGVKGMSAEERRRMRQIHALAHEYGEFMVATYSKLRQIEGGIGDEMVHTIRRAIPAARAFLEMDLLEIARVTGGTYKLIDWPATMHVPGIRKLARPFAKPFMKQYTNETGMRKFSLREMARMRMESDWGYRHYAAYGDSKAVEQLLKGAKKELIEEALDKKRESVQFNVLVHEQSGAETVRSGTQSLVAAKRHATRDHPVYISRDEYMDTKDQIDSKPYIHMNIGPDNFNGIYEMLFKPYKWEGVEFVISHLSDEVADKLRSQTRPVVRYHALVAANNRFSAFKEGWCEGFALSYLRHLGYEVRGADIRKDEFSDWPIGEYSFGGRGVLYERGLRFFDSLINGDEEKAKKVLREALFKTEFFNMFENAYRGKGYVY